MNFRKKISLDIFDQRLLKELPNDASQSDFQLRKKIGIFSTLEISKGIKLLTDKGFIRGIQASLNGKKCDLNYPVVILVRGKYGLNYIGALGEKLKKLIGILSTYDINDDIDFVVFAV